MSTKAYILVNFNDRDKLVPAVAAIDGLPGLTRWDAVDGPHDLVIGLNAEDSPSVKKIEELDGCSAVASCAVKAEGNGELSLSDEYAYSYLFIETERYQQKAVESSLEKIEAVVFCAAATGGCDLVALVKGDNFDQIDRIVNNNIRQLDGVLRLKQDRIIFLDRM